jgi:hypothetical protein
MKKLVGFFLCMVLIMAATPGAMGNLLFKQPLKIYDNTLMEFEKYSDILFSDDFNDNQKDFDKWTELYDKGVWEETNGRTEFQLTESGGAGARFEGIESSKIQAMIGGDEPWENKLTITWQMISDIGSTSLEGEALLRITDGRNWIEVGYDRSTDKAIYRDSLGNGDEFVGGDEPWENKLDIYVDKYEIIMNSNSATIDDSVFKDGVSTFNVQIFIKLAGSSRDLYQQSGFDDVIVQGISGCCFPAGTKITMADGSYKNIEDVESGDWVKCYNVENHKTSKWMVKMRGAPIHPVFEINNGLISTTVDHPFYIKKSDDSVGWGAIDVERAEKVNIFSGKFLKLEVGDYVFNYDGEWIEITSIVSSDELVRTYNILSFSGGRTYFANDILVYEEHPPNCLTSNFLEFICERFPQVFPLIKFLLKL